MDAACLTICLVCVYLFCMFGLLSMVCVVLLLPCFSFDCLCDVIMCYRLSRCLLIMLFLVYYSIIVCMLLVVVVVVWFVCVCTLGVVLYGLYCVDVGLLLVCGLFFVMLL